MTKKESSMEACGERDVGVTNYAVLDAVVADLQTLGLYAAASCTTGGGWYIYVCGDYGCHDAGGKYGDEYEAAGAALDAWCDADDRITMYDGCGDVGDMICVNVVYPEGD